MTEEDNSDRSLTEKYRPSGLKEVLIADRWKIIILLSIIVIASIFLGFSPTIPRWLRLGGLVLVLTAFAAYPYARFVVQYLYSPEYVWLLDVDARENEVAVWKYPPEEFRQITVDGPGELHEVRAKHPTWECRNLDPEEHEAEGTWRASATDIELIRDQEKIDEIRSELEDLAQEGLTLRVKQSGIIRNSLRKIINSFIAAYEGEAVFDGEKIDEAVNEALDGLDLDADDEPEETQAEATHDEPTKQATPAGANIILDPANPRGNGVRKSE